MIVILMQSLTLIIQSLVRNNHQFLINAVQSLDSVDHKNVLRALVLEEYWDLDARVGCSVTFCVNGLIS
jgi:hypothetical protein